MKQLHVDQARVFRSLRWRLLVNSWRVFLTGSMVRPLTILLCTLFVCGFVFGASYAGFRFLIVEFQIPAGGGILGLLFSLLFFTLGILLIFSAGLILYGSLFGQGAKGMSAETPFLLSTPARADHVFAFKFQGALGFSSWAFLLLGFPLLLAYGLVVEAPWYFYLLLPIFFLGFVLLPGSLGAILCLLVVAYLPRRRKEILLTLFVGLLTLTGWWIYQTAQELRNPTLGTEAETTTNLFNRIAFANGTWMPSRWVAHGLLSAAAGKVNVALHALGLVWSNGLMCYLMATWTAGRFMRRGFNRLSTGGDLRKRHGGAWLDRLVERAFGFLQPGTRLLLVKDFRTFRRDPQQWGQVLVFTGLLLAYFANVRRLFVREIEWPYQNSISGLNLWAISLLLCAYTGRFIYPLLSLEGQKIWILGLAPLSRDQLLWGKFVFSLTGALTLAVPLTLVSDLMLDMPLDVLVLHQVTVIVLAAGLSGLAVGLGACLPNFKETDPSKITVGFGGTMNLVAGLLFLLLTLALMAGPWHLGMIVLGIGPEASRPLWFLLLWLSCGLVGLVLGLAAVVLPLRAGLANLRRMEF